MVEFLKTQGSLSDGQIAWFCGIKLSSVSSAVSRARKFAPKGKQIECIDGKYRLVKDYVTAKVEKQMKLRRVRT